MACSPVVRRAVVPSRALCRPGIDDPAEKRLSMEDAGECVHISHHVVVLGHVVLFADSDPLAESQPDIRHGHIMLSDEIVNVCAETEAARVDLSDAGNAARILLD